MAFLWKLGSNPLPQKHSPLYPAYLCVLNSFPPHFALHFAPLCDSVPCRTVYSMPLIIVVTHCLTVTHSCLTFLYFWTEIAFFALEPHPKMHSCLCVCECLSLSLSLTLCSFQVSSSSSLFSKSFITGPPLKLNVLFLYYNCCYAFCWMFLYFNKLNRVSAITLS